jgi:hypothetical protein
VFHNRAQSLGREGKATLPMIPLPHHPEKARRTQMQRQQSCHIATATRLSLPVTCAFRLREVYCVEFV